MIAHVESLRVCYDVQNTAPALDGVSLEIHPGEVLAVMGASGSGKTTLGRVLGGATHELPAEVNWQHFLAARRPAIIEQEAYESMHPLIRVHRQLRDCLPSQEDPAELLAAVGLNPMVYGGRYPHELSGGEVQRVAIARALSLASDLIVADEITANLDVISSVLILKILRDGVTSRRTGCLLITHDLDVCRAVADRVMIMAEGRVVEECSAWALRNEPHEAYTRELIAATRGRLL